MKILRFLGLLLSVVPALGAPPKLTNLVLYQPDKELHDRDVTPHSLSEYVKKLQAVVEGRANSPAKELLEIVVIVKPSGKARVWFVANSTTQPWRETLQKELEAVPTMKVARGPVAFAMAFSFNDAAPRDVRPDHFAWPIPEQWKGAMNGLKKSPLLVPDDLIPYIWPDQIPQS